MDPKVKADIQKLFNQRDELLLRQAATAAELVKVEKQLDALAPVAWEPACGGTETEFTCNGQRFLYMFNLVTRDHATYCFDEDLFYDDEEMREISAPDICK